MPVLLIANSIVCALGVMGGGMLLITSIMSLANLPTAHPERAGWAAPLIVASGGVPVAFLAGGIAAWIAYFFGASHLVPWLVALPWLYGAAFVAAMYFVLPWEISGVP